MNKSFKIATLTLCIASVLSPFVNAKVSNSKNSYHKGEDGQLYWLNETAQSETSGLTSKGTQGKVSLAVQEKAKQQKTLDVIIFLDAKNNFQALSQIEDQYQPVIQDLADKLRMIESRYRPTDSLTEEQEQAFMRSDAAKMSVSDVKLTRQIKEQLDEVRDNMRRQKALSVKQAASGVFNDMRNMLQSSGGKINNTIELSNAIGATIPSDMLAQVGNLPQVRAVELDRPVDLELNVSMPSASYNTWHGSFDGYPYDFGVVDTGVRENHPAFTSGSVGFCSKPGSSITGDHGTHVTGIVASNNATYKGTAFGVDQVIWANSGGQSTTMANMQWMITGSCQGPEVVNHSLGYGVADDTDYSNSDAFYDAFVQNYNVMVTKSTGNSGWNDTDPTITHPAPAYNLMAVANMNDRNTTSRSDDVRSSSSSVGPTLSNRKKPDIAAPGSSIMSTNSDWATEADFISKGGTSMAAPHVAGAIVLMEDAGNHIPMAQKAVLLNTADGWTSNNTSGTGDDARVYGVHWDKSYGWGYIDMWEAHFNRADYFYSSVIPRNNNATADDYKLFKGRMYNNEKATLVWQRRANFAAGPLGSAYNLSDLNLRLYEEGSNVLKDSDFDGNDNVHQVAADATLDAVIKVYAWSSSFDGASSEYFALATEEAFSAANPPALQIPTQNFTGSSFTIIPVNLNVKNNGDVDTCSVNVTRGTVSGVSGSTSATISKINDGSSANAGFSLSASSGTYYIPFTATTTCYNETYTGTGRIKLVVN